MHKATGHADEKVNSVVSLSTIERVLNTILIFDILILVDLNSKYHMDIEVEILDSIYLHIRILQ